MTNISKYQKVAFELARKNYSLKSRWKDVMYG